MAAPTPVAFYSADTQPASGASSTSASLTVQTGDVVTFTAVGEGRTTGDTFGTPTTTLSNGGITQLKLHPSSSDCEAGAWTFTVTANGSGTVSVPHTWTTGGTGNPHVQLTVWVHRAATAAIATRSALGTGSARTVSYPASQPDSTLVWAVGDWAAATLQSLTPTSTSHTSASPGPTAMPESATVTGVYSQYAAVLDDQPSTASTAYGIGGTGTGPFTIVVVEIQGTGGGSTPNPFHPKPASRAPIFRASTF